MRWIGEVDEALTMDELALSTCTTENTTRLRKLFLKVLAGNFGNECNLTRSVIKLRKVFLFSGSRIALMIYFQCSKAINVIDLLDVNEEISESLYFRKVKILSAPLKTASDVMATVGRLVC